MAKQAEIFLKVLRAAFAQKRTLPRLTRDQLGSANVHGDCWVWALSVALGKAIGLFEVLFFNVTISILFVKDRWRSLPSAGLLPEWLQQPELSCFKAGS